MLSLSHSLHVSCCLSVCASIWSAYVCVCIIVGPHSLFTCVYLSVYCLVHPTMPVYVPLSTRLSFSVCVGGIDRDVDNGSA